MADRMLTIGDVYQPVNPVTVAQMIQAGQRNRINQMSLEQQARQIAKDRTVDRILQGYFGGAYTGGQPPQAGQPLPNNVTNLIGVADPQAGLTLSGQRAGAQNAQRAEAMKIIQANLNGALQSGDNNTWQMLMNKARELNPNIPDTSGMQIVGKNTWQGPIEVKNGVGPDKQPITNPATGAPLPDGMYNVKGRGMGPNKQILEVKPAAGAGASRSGVSDYATFYKGFAHDHPELKGGALDSAVSEAWKERQGDISEARGMGYAQSRPAQVYDTVTGKPLTMSLTEVMAGNKEQPGRYLTGTRAERALKQKALIEDIRGGIDVVRTSIDKVQPFSATQRAKLALVLKTPNAESAISNFVGSSWAETLTPEQQDYVINVLSLREQAMALRTVLGAGQGSKDLRDAIMQTIPGAMTPNKVFAEKQLTLLDHVLDRVSRGIMNVPLRPMGEGKKGAELQQTGGNPPTLEEFIPAAREASREVNPNVTDAELTEFYNNKYGGR